MSVTISTKPGLLMSGFRYGQRRRRIRFMQATLQNWRCFYCLGRLTWAECTNDHIIPLSTRGVTRNNGAVHNDPHVVVTHPRCNHLRGTYPFDLFLRILDARQMPRERYLHTLWYARRRNKANGVSLEPSQAEPIYRTLSPVDSRPSERELCYNGIICT